MGVGEASPPLRVAEMPMMPSATCPLKRPVSYVWQPTTIRSVNARGPSPKCTWSV